MEVLPGRMAVLPERQTPAHWIALAIAGVVAAAALAYVKWWPLWHKATAALATHRYSATSILTGGAAVAPTPSWHAAWTFAQAYYGAVWMAVIAGIVVAGAVQALLPQRFFQRFLAGSNLQATLLATASALPAFF
jgi:uncharacterized protein